MKTYVYKLLPHINQVNGLFVASSQNGNSRVNRNDRWMIADGDKDHAEMMMSRTATTRSCTYRNWGGRTVRRSDKRGCRGSQHCTVGKSRRE